MRSTLAIGLLVWLSSLPTPAHSADDPPLTPASLRLALAEKPTGADAERLARAVRSWFGRASLLKGAAPKVDGLDVAWAIEAPKATAPPRVVGVMTDTASHARPMTRIGETDVYALVAKAGDGEAFHWAFEVDGRRVEVGNGQLEVYATHPDSVEQPGVPKGTLTQQPRRKSQIFPGTERDWWVYVPSQYTPETPACVMVFQDGGRMQEFVPTVLDNLIAKKDMPVTVGVFINPGVFANGRSNRSFEYDTLSDQYSRFLLEEILPEVEKTIQLRQDADSRALCGSSSGGICAWTVAWERPDKFHKVLSWVGSFTDIASGESLREGGHNYPALIRKTPRKPIRILLQDGSNDLDNSHGNWPLANQQMAKALAFAGYDYKFVYGQGFHGNKHGRAILPDSLRWLWRPDDSPESSQPANP